MKGLETSSFFLMFYYIPGNTFGLSSLLIHLGFTVLMLMIINLF